jgi:hypothetical protein
MLGLGSALYTGGGITPQLLGTYTSDFSSGVDGWSGDSVEGTLTLTGGNNRPGGSGDPNWLKGAFNQTQTGFVAIAKSISPSWSTSSNDYFVATANLWLHNVSGQDWGGTDSVHTVFSSKNTTSGIGGDIGANVAQGENVSLEVTQAIGDSGYNQIRIYWTLGGDLPQADAEFYIKNIEFKFYG